MFKKIFLVSNVHFAAGAHAKVPARDDERVAAVCGALQHGPAEARHGGERVQDRGGAVVALHPLAGFADAERLPILRGVSGWPKAGWQSRRRSWRS